MQWKAVARMVKQRCDYWTRQWASLDPHVEPTDFTSEPDGRTIVHVHPAGSQI